MMQRSSIRRTVAVVLCASLLAAPAMADIKSFNAAVKAHDYKLATTEARATWPTLDKSRADLPSIAREFGFAAYRGGDFIAAEFFAERAIGAGQAEAEDLRLASEMLLQMAKLKLDPSRAVRGRVHAALERRGELPGVDLISYYASEAITSYAFGKGDWRDANTTAAAISKLAGQAGDAPPLERHRFELLSQVALFFDKRNQEPHDALGEVSRRVLADINAAPDDASAMPLLEVYWDARAWREAMSAHLTALHRFKPDAGDGVGLYTGLSTGDRAVRMLNLSAMDGTCTVKMTMSKRPQYPVMANLSGISGAVILQVDIDETGTVSNGKVLGAVPLKSFGNAVLRSVKDIRYTRGDKWSPACKLARKGRVAAFSFAIR